MADLIARALGRAALKKAVPPYKLVTPASSSLDLKRFYTPEVIARYTKSVDEMFMLQAMDTETYLKNVEQDCFNALAEIIESHYPGLSVTGEALRERMGQIIRDSEALSKLRLKYGWHDASKVVPNHSRHVLVWTQRGEYRAWYDHKFGCWRVRRDGLKITHWREQCGPENWPAAK